MDLLRCPGISAMSQAEIIPAFLLCAREAIPATGTTISAPYIAGSEDIAHHTACSEGISSNQDRAMPPSAKDQENRGGLGLIPPVG